MPSLMTWQSAVECNRRGVLSEDQRDVLAHAAGAIWLPVVIIGFALLFFVLPVAGAAIQLLTDLGDRPGLYAFGGLAIVGACVNAWVLRAEILRRRLKADLASPAVARVPGRVLWRHAWPRGYTLQTEDESGAIRASFAPLGTGLHWCYVLQRSRILVGAETVGAPDDVWSIGEFGISEEGTRYILGVYPRDMAGVTRTRSPIDAAAPARVFGEAMGFDITDLEDNRRGRMSSHQRTRRLIPATVATLVAATPALILGYGGWLAFGAMFAVSAFLMLGAVAYLAYVLEVVHGGVRSLDSAVTPWIETKTYKVEAGQYQEHVYHYLKAGEALFAVNERVISALSAVGGEGRRFRLYIATWGGRLLSMEPLWDSSAQPASVVHQLRRSS